MSYTCNGNFLRWGSRLTNGSNFPNPTLDERKQYTLYWKGKLASNKDISFPKGLEDEVAERTDKFSFAYLKEALCVPILSRSPK